MHEPSGDKFSVDEWLKSIDIWDENFNYVMHDDHWLTSKWSADCEKCQSAKEDLIDLNETFDLYRSAIADTPKVNHHKPNRGTETKQTHHQLQQLQQQLQQQQLQQQHNLQQQQQGVSSKIPKIPVRLSRQF